MLETLALRKVRRSSRLWCANKKDYPCGWSFLKDTNFLERCYLLHEKNDFRVIRSANNSYKEMYDSMVAWQNIPFVAKDDKDCMIKFYIN